MNDSKILLANKLKELNKLITTEDRQAYIDANPISPQNLSLYLNGKGVDVEKAVRMVEFFKGRIAERNEKIEALVK